MSDDFDSEWVVIVPPRDLPVADSLWADWLQQQTSAVPAEDIRIDHIRADKGALRRYRVRGAHLSGEHKDSTDGGLGGAIKQSPSARIFDDIIDDIRHGSLTIGDTEAVENMRWLSLTAEQAAETSADSVAGFLEEVRLAYSSLVSDQLDTGQLRFYTWVDEQAGQLRFSVSSTKPLPFRCLTQFVPDVHDIARQFLTSPYLDGIPWSELDSPDSTASTFEDQSDGDDKPLNVYVVALRPADW